MTHTFRHPSYYAELKKQDKKSQAPSEDNKEIQSGNEQDGMGKLLGVKPKKSGVNLRVAP